MEFSILDIISVLIKRLKYILSFSILTLLTVYAVNRFVISPTYTVSTHFYVDERVSTETSSLNQLYYAQKVVSTYISFLQTKQFYKAVAQESGLNYTPETIQAMTTIIAVNDTEIFEIIVTTNRAEDSYTLIKAMEEIAPDTIQSIKNSAQINMIDSVEYPKAPSGPNIIFNTFIGGVLGFFLSIIVCILIEILDTKVKNKEDLSKRYDIPLIGCIPNFKNFRIKKNILRRHRTPEQSINDNSKFIINEAFQSIRMNLRFILQKEGCKKILINSSLSNEGKSTVAVNLAISIAQSGLKVLLLDCDLRNGMLHRLLGLKELPGISDIISGAATEKDVIQHTKYNNLQVITTGINPPNPNELLGSVQMEELIKRLEKLYDYIIIDSPPISLISDAICMVKVIDGILFIVREGVTTHPNIKMAINRYQLSNTKILGFVLNVVSFKNSSKQKSQYTYYSK